MPIEYPRSNGTIEVAASLEEAYKVCPFLGRMSLEQAAVFVEVFQRGADILEQDQVKPTMEAIPRANTPDITLEHAKQVDKIETVITPVQLSNNRDIIRETADILASLNPVIEDKLEAVQPVTLVKDKTPKTEALIVRPKPETVLSSPSHTPDNNNRIRVEKERTESAVVEESKQTLPIPKAIEVTTLAQATEDETIVEINPVLEIIDVNEELIASETEPEANGATVNQITALDIEDDPENQISQQMLNIETIEPEADAVIVEMAQEIESALGMLDETEEVVVNETIEQIVALLSIVVPESETQTAAVFEQLSVEEVAELSELIETLCAAIGYEITDDNLDVKIFIQALSQVFPSLKPVILTADLERDGTKEAKRQYQRYKGNDLSVAFSNLSRLLGMLVLLRSIAILPKEFYYQ